jgi:starch synthase
VNGVSVLSVVSELYPFVKTGGLADVAAALPRALREHGVAVTTLLPGYPAVLAKLQGANEMLQIADCFGGSGRVLADEARGILALDAPHLFVREGNPYLGPDGKDWPDNAFRFGALAWAAARIGLGDAPAWHPDIVHAHDWQAALAIGYLAYAGGDRPKTVLTVHNLAFQGIFPARLLHALRLPAHAYAIHGVEFYGSISFLKAGLQFADRITTVSPTYAHEIQTPANGCGLDGLLRERAKVLRGIVNGIDVQVWNPATDPRIAFRYDRSSVSARQPNKSVLQRRFGLCEDSNHPVFAAISRFTAQKGVDLLAGAAPALRAMGAQLAILGAGERDLEERITSVASAHRGEIACLIGYDEDLAHQIQAGADAIIVPSRFEPCGLTQLCALRYGAIPLVARVGGLADTVVDLAETTRGLPTGLSFSPVTQDALDAALRRAALMWKDAGQWSRVQANGMATDVSWSGSARRYANLYAELLATKN